MKKKIFFSLLLTSNFLLAQVGVNTDTPKVTLELKALPNNLTIADGFNAPRLTGDELKTKDDLYLTEHIGTIVFITKEVTTASTKTINVTSTGYFYFDGEKWVKMQPIITDVPNTDKNTYLGGTVYTKFQAISGGTIDNSQLIGGNTNVTYNLGTYSTTSKKGALTGIQGTGFKVSNPSSGIFDIQFDTPFTEIYGLTVNIFDSYGRSSIVSGANNNTTTPGNQLKTNDNTQIGFLSESIIRIKTGNQNGLFSNRTFTFLVIGKN